MTQEELSDKSGVHTTEISRLEHGRGNPTIQTLKRLAEGLDHPCSRIFALEEIFEREREESV
jgi:transcriptional regulator with XRE-family HTH domain